jgi:hypothetical protein
MRMQLKHLVILIGIFTLIGSLQSCGRRKNEKNTNPNSHEVVVEEVIQSSQYTYLKVKEDDKDFWIAISKQEVEKGKTYFIGTGLEMKSFTSKELKRTFDVIFFIQDFSDQPIPDAKKLALSKMAGKKTVEKKEGIKVEPAKGGITIAELFSKKDSYAGKTVRISGEVVKFNSGIMDRNWVHIQDGTDAGGSFDLTVTTKDVVKIGDKVEFEGTVSLNKDFGAGYSYDVIMEDAKLPSKL